MRKVVILSGISGSGKSTLAEKLLNESQGVKVSADHFFTKPDGKGSVSYQFDPSKLGEAHADCFARFIRFCQDPNGNLIVVDNTNTSAEEIAPYILGAAAFGWEAEIITLRAPFADRVQKCAGRNIHGVPLDTIKAQANRLLNRKLPRFWKNTDRVAEFSDDE